MRDNILQALFGERVHIEDDLGGVFHGSATTAKGVQAGVIGVTGGVAIGIDVASALSRHVLDHIVKSTNTPLILLVDAQSQKMARRDELLGLNEYLSHLAKSLNLASQMGCRTVGLLYGKAAAGAFIATALATDWLVTLPGAEPSVMDLPSIARITKLPLDKLQEMAKTTSIFAPGVDHLSKTGAVTETWDDAAKYGEKLDALLARAFEGDHRDAMGAERGGRRVAAKIARQVTELAMRDG